jgi:hypothetical protein
MKRKIMGVTIGMDKERLKRCRFMSCTALVMDVEPHNIPPGESKGSQQGPGGWEAKAAHHAPGAMLT